MPRSCIKRILFLSSSVVIITVMSIIIQQIQHQYYCGIEISFRTSIRFYESIFIPQQFSWLLPFIANSLCAFTLNRRKKKFCINWSVMKHFALNRFVKIKLKKKFYFLSSSFFIRNVRCVLHLLNSTSM